MLPEGSYYTALRISRVTTYADAPATIGFAYTHSDTVWVVCMTTYFILMGKVFFQFRILKTLYLSK